MLILPAIDLRAGRCVRLTQGRKETAKIYDANPVDVAQAFEAAGARMLHVVDLDAAFSDSNVYNRKVLTQLIGSINIPIQFGGGLRSTEDVEQVIQLGVARVVIGTVAAESIETLEKIIQLIGSKFVAVGIDAQNGMVMTRGWEKKESISALSLARKVASVGSERVIYTDVQRDGTLTGPNIEQTCTIARTGLKVTASGGISSLEDLRSLQAVSNCGIDSVIIGKALYEGRFTLKEALTLCDDR
jgi:phosphoribosylformimino-5-aminoimidazole carboxamide ribotide isomerase